MRRIEIAKLKVGMTLAKPIYAVNGVVLLANSIILTVPLINKVNEIGVEYVYIIDEISKGIEIESVITEETLIETKKVLTESIDKMKAGYFVASKSLIAKVEMIIEDVLSNKSVMVSLQEIRKKDDYLHMHSINVCVISLILGKKMNYNDAQLRHLALGAILHDIGKIKIDHDVTRYREDYIEQEYKIYKEHVIKGFGMMKDFPNASLLAANVALTHHEHYDGTGFPLGKRNTGIHEFARIVAVANEYDNLLYNLPKRMHMRHYEIIEMIVSRAYTWFDPEIIKVFRKSISPYPVSTGVVLSDGRIGIIVNINEDFPTRPLVRVVDKVTMGVIEEVDLSKNLSVMIVDEKEIDK